MNHMWIHKKKLAHDILWTKIDVATYDFATRRIGLFVQTKKLISTHVCPSRRLAFFGPRPLPPQPVSDHLFECSLYGSVAALSLASYVNASTFITSSRFYIRYVCSSAYSNKQMCQHFLYLSLKWNSTAKPIGFVSEFARKVASDTRLINVGAFGVQLNFRLVVGRETRLTANSKWFPFSTYVCSLSIFLCFPFGIYTFRYIRRIKFPGLALYF